LFLGNWEHFVYLFLTLAFNMINLGVPIEDVQSFINKMCIINSINSEYQEILIGSINGTYERIQNETLENNEVIFIFISQEKTRMRSDSTIDFDKYTNELSKNKLKNLNDFDIKDKDDIEIQKLEIYEGVNDDVYNFISSQENLINENENKLKEKINEN
jgi:hypothetical protein